MPSARAKQFAMLKKILDSRYETLPPWRAPWQQPQTTMESLGRILLDKGFQKEVVDAPYHIRSDERPPRDKLFHRLGTCAACDFRQHPLSPFTGVFAQPAPVVVRLSLATSPTLYAPGLAFKLFRDGALSSINLLAAPGLDPQTSRDFFAYPAHTTVPPPTDPLARAFFAVLGSRHSPYSLDLRAATEQEGGDTVVPKVLTFEPLQHISGSANRDLRDELAEMVPGKDLWEVHAEGVPVGTIRLTSRFFASSYGDRVLHFPHA